MNVISRFSLGAIAIFIAAAIVQLLRIATTPAPIYAGDEYAYIKHGLDFGRVEAVAQEQRDPGLQKISSQVYSRIIRSCADAFGDPTPVLRVINFLAYFGAIAGVGLWVLRLHSTPSSRGWFLLLLGLQPGSVCVLSAMPDVVLTASYTVLALATLALLRRAPILVAAAAGVGLGVLLYVKPHAVAAVAGFAVFFVVRALSDREAGWWQRTLVPAVFALGVLGAVFTVNALVLGEVSFAPRFVGGVYSHAVRSAFSLERVVSASASIGRYLLLHCLVLAMVLPVAVAAIAEGIRARFRSTETGNCSFWGDFALLSVLVGGAVLLMVAQFTAAVGGQNPSEANRLHGRYLFLIFPSLCILASHRLASIDTSEDSWIGRLLRRRAAIIGYGLLALVALWLLNGVKIFPWDYPEIFSLFRSPNAYWNGNSLAATRMGVLIGLAAAVGVGLVIPRFTVWVLGLFQVLVFGASLLSVTYWQETHARANQSLGAAGAVLRMTCGPAVGELLLVAPDRWGATAYVLSGIRGSPWVRTAPAGSELSEAFVPAAVRIVATLGRYEPRFPFRAHEKQGPLNVYWLDLTTGARFAPAAPLWQRRSFTADLSSTKRNVGLFGFNLPEPWGVWSAEKQATLVLPVRIEGAVQMRFRAWVPIGGAAEVELEIGGARTTVALTSQPTNYAIQLNVKTPDDRLRIACPVIVRPNPWERGLGVALSNITIAP